MNNKKNSLLKNIVLESSAYNTFKEIEKLVEIGSDLSMIPIQPLYVSLLSAPAAQVANILPRLSQEQRQALVDLDFWNKDVVDVSSFEYWIESYALCKDEQVVGDFIKGEDFLLYLKSRVNIYTFDAEDPMYPDHDYYFLTDDNLLLVEYGQDYNHPNKLKYLIRMLYDVLGVENAYTKLFKLINDSFSLLQESNYLEKKERLRDYGFVDYYEAREKLFSFVTFSQIKKYILSKENTQVAINTMAKNQSLHSSALIGFDRENENIINELVKLDDTKREHFLHFTFIRLINSTITVSGALRKGRVELTRLAHDTKKYIDLGLQYTRSTLSDFSQEKSLFEKFDFFDFYKVGISLIQINKTKYIKELKKTIFQKEENEYFLGAWWNSFLENSDLNIPKVKGFGVGLHAVEVDGLKTFEFWSNEVDVFCKQLPFIEKFYNMLNNLRESNSINNDFYVNYKLEEIDFEAIVISSYINHVNETQEVKLGVTIEEFKKFMNSCAKKIAGEYILKTQDEIKVTINSFLNKYGLDEVNGFSSYLYGILIEHLNGYDFDSLDFDDYAHVGGPIIFSHLIN
ncbi:MAG: DUF6178 family protein [Bacteriovoracaceae bacterium]|jgi:hypothetical protein|nr:DUF6178 family protein [Bacteriovoracaceae bacterium]